MKAYFWWMFMCKGICKNMYLGYAKVSNNHNVNVFTVECNLPLFVEIPFLFLLPWTVVTLKVTKTRYI